MHGSMSMMFEVPDGERGEEAETINFLRRFAGMMSGGTSAGKLQQCAEVVERLVRRTSESERQAEQAEVRCNAYRDLCATAEAAIHDLRCEIAALEKRIEAQQAASERALAADVEEKQQLNALIARSETERDDMRREIACRDVELEALSGCSVVPLATMCAIRDQFRALADQGETDGDLVAMTMCAIGSTLAEQAIAASRSTILDQDEMMINIRPASSC
jgi:predicted RNase H-like nuclease (RuvC/YqgF family)